MADAAALAANSPAWWRKLVARRQSQWSSSAARPGSARRMWVVSLPRASRRPAPVRPG